MKFIAAVVLCGAVALLAQEFEAASIKPAIPDRAGTLVGFVPGGGLRVNN